MNAPGSLAKVAGATAQAVTNPYDTAVGLEGLLENEYGAMTGGPQKSVLKDRYVDNFRQTLEQDPMGLVSDMMAVMGGGGNLMSVLGKGATRAGLLSEGGRLANFAQDAGRVGSQMVAASDMGVGEGIYRGADMLKGGSFGKAGEVAGHIIKPGLDTVDMAQDAAGKVKDISSIAVDVAGKPLGKTIDFVKENISGLSKAEREGIQSNPYIKEYWDQAKKTIDESGVPQDLKEVIRPQLKQLGESLLGEIENVQNRFSETGPLYEKVKNIDMKVDTSSASSKLNDILTKHDVKVKPDGSFDFDTSVIISPSDMTAIERVYKKLTNSQELTPKQVLDIRKSLNPLMGWDSNVTKDSQRILREMRGVIDDIAKEQVPGLKELDASYSKQIDDLNELKDGLFYRESTRRGELKDNFYSIIKNIGGENRANMRERLLKVMPDLEARVDAINNVPRLVRAYNTKPNILRNIGGTVATGLLGYGAGGIEGAIVGGLVGYFGDAVFKKIRQGSIEKAINGLSPKAQQRLAEITQKIQDNAKLSSSDKIMLNSIKTKIDRANEEASKKKLITKDNAIVKKNGKPVSYKGLSQKILNDGGITLNVKGNKNLSGKPYIAVSPYPNRSEILKKTDFTDKSIADYIWRNRDKILQDGHTLGGRVDGEDIYLDVALAIPKKYKKQAIELGKKYNQKAVFDLENFKEINTMGDGTSIPVDENIILQDIQSLFSKKKPGKTQ